MPNDVPDWTFQTQSPVSAGWTLIKTVGPLLASASTMDISAIPTTYTHLLLVHQLRSDRGGGANNTQLGLYFNGDTANNYGWQKLYSFGGTVTGVESGGAAAAFIDCGFISAAGSLASVPGSGKIWIPNYLNSTFFKTVTAESIAFNSGAFPAASQLVTSQSGGLWHQQSAINEITLFSPTGFNLIAGSIISLYGGSG